MKKMIPFWAGCLLVSMAMHIGAEPVATIETTLGTFKVKLFQSQAPKTVANFIKLSNDKFYDGVIFHRIIKGFMNQTGDPDGTGRGGPGYTFEDEFVAELKHDKPGMLSMANRGPNTNGSQFFITAAATPWLDGKHTVFGEVIEGMDVCEKINKSRVGPGDTPLEEIAMVSVTITEGA
jgi:cyclophilin family peptidyl-prolyl cis-trans isomerase